MARPLHWLCIMKIKSLLEGPPVTVKPDDTLGLALQAMLWGELRHLPVVRDGDLVGVLSQRDILATQARLGVKAAGQAQVATAMTKPAITVSPEEDDATAARRMTDARIGCLPVVAGGKVVGLITRGDLLRATHPETADHRDLDQLKVSDLMQVDVATAAADDALLDVVARMGSRAVRHAPVVDGERRVIGMLSDRDVRGAVGNALRPLGVRDAVVRISSLKVGNVMSRNPRLATRDLSVSQAAALLAGNGIGALPVVDHDERLVGIVSYVDILRILAPAGEPRGRDAR